MFCDFISISIIICGDVLVAQLVMSVSVSPESKSHVVAGRDPIIDLSGLSNYT